MHGLSSTFDFLRMCFFCCAFRLCVLTLQATIVSTTDDWSLCLLYSFHFRFRCDIFRHLQNHISSRSVNRDDFSFSRNFGSLYHGLQKLSLSILPSPWNLGHVNDGSLQIQVYTKPYKIIRSFIEKSDHDNDCITRSIMFTCTILSF